MTHRLKKYISSSHKNDPIDNLVSLPDKITKFCCESIAALSVIFNSVILNKCIIGMVYSKILSAKSVTGQSNKLPGILRCTLKNVRVMNYSY